MLRGRVLPCSHLVSFSVLVTVLEDLDVLGCRVPKLGRDRVACEQSLATSTRACLLYIVH